MAHWRRRSVFKATSHTPTAPSDSHPKPTTNTEAISALATNPSCASRDHVNRAPSPDTQFANVAQDEPFPTSEKPFTNGKVDLSLWPPFVRVDQLALLQSYELRHVLAVTEAFLQLHSQSPGSPKDERLIYAEKQLAAARKVLGERAQVDVPREDCEALRDFEPEERKEEADSLSSTSSLKDAAEATGRPAFKVSKEKGAALMMRQASQEDFVIYAGVKQDREKTKALEREKMKKAADRVVARRSKQRQKDRLRKQEEARRRIADREKRRMMWEKERQERVECAEKYRREREHALQRKRALRKEAKRVVEAKEEVKGTAEVEMASRSDEDDDEEEQTAVELEMLAEALEEERAANEGEGVDETEFIHGGADYVTSPAEGKDRPPLNLAQSVAPTRSLENRVNDELGPQLDEACSLQEAKHSVELAVESLEDFKVHVTSDGEKSRSSPDCESKIVIESSTSPPRVNETPSEKHPSPKHDRLESLDTEAKVDDERKSLETDHSPPNKVEQDIIQPTSNQTHSPTSHMDVLVAETVDKKDDCAPCPTSELNVNPKEVGVKGGDNGEKRASIDEEEKESFGGKSEDESYCDQIIQEEFGGKVVDYSGIFGSFAEVFAVVHDGKKLTLEEISVLMAKTVRYFGTFNRIARAIEDDTLGATMATAVASFYRIHFRSRSEVYNIVKDACSRLGYEELPKNMNLQTSWNLLWTWTKPRVNREDLLCWHRVNHFQESKFLTRKDLFNKCLERVRCLSRTHAEYFDIQPTTFVLPKEYLKFVRAYADIDDAEDNIWIMKPVGLSRGRGISLIADISDVSYGQSVIIQRYVSNPLTLDGFKYDLRLYVLVTSFQPLEAYVYEEGFVRVCTLPYSTHPGSLKDLRIHLTNSSIQQVDGAGTKASKATRERHGAFIHEAGGTKLSLPFLWRRLEASGVDVPALKVAIEETLVKSLMCAKDNFSKACNSFELYGYDVLIDSDLKPWLVEINSSPSLGLDNELDHKIKRQLIYDTVRLVNPLPYDRKALEEVLSRRVVDVENQRLRPYLSTPIPANDQLNRDLTAILRGAMPRKPGEAPADIGAYRKIAPDTQICQKTEKLLRRNRSGQTPTARPSTLRPSGEPSEQKLARLALQAGVRL